MPTTYAIPNGRTAFNPVLYTGTSATQSITGVGFQPDFVWLKARSGAFQHGQFDAVRGATKGLVSNTTDAETTFSAVTSFNSNGFTNGTDYNNSGTTYVSWNWKANGAGSSNTAGSITSTVSANTTAGFSIVTFTAPSSGSGTVGHGLGVAPSMMIWKSRSNTDSWTTYHISLGSSNALFLNSTNASFGLTWGTINSTVFTADTSQNCTASRTYVAYCFAAVAGYSAFGSYTGNGSADGPFIYTGFRPAFVIVKNSGDAGVNWLMFDTTVNPNNSVTKYLLPNSTAAEQSDLNLDMVSNGFKPRIAGGTGINQNNSNYIYAAFAENPFKYANAR
jgi:hypothetical protein